MNGMDVCDEKINWDVCGQCGGPIAAGVVSRVCGACLNAGWTSDRCRICGELPARNYLVKGMCLECSTMPAEIVQQKTSMHNNIVWAASSPPVSRPHCPTCGGPLPCHDEDCIQAAR